MTKKLFDIGIIYFIGQLFVKGISFLLIPLYSRYLGAEVYGELAIVDIYSSFFASICIFSIYSGYIRFYYEDKDNKGFATAFNFSIVCILLYGLIILIFGKNYLSRLIGIKNSNLILWLIFIRVSIEQLITLLETRYNMEYLVKKVILFRIVITITSLLLIIYFVIIKKETIIGIYLGWILGQVLVLLYLLWDNFKYLNISFNFKRKIFKQMMKFSFSLLLGSLSYLVLSLIDRFFLKEYQGFADVGIYSMGYKFATLVDVFFIFSFKKIFTPFKFKEYKKKDFEDKVNKFYNYYNLIGGILFLGISVNIKFILFLFTSKEFLAAYTITPLIVFSYLLYGQAEFYTLGIHLTNRVYFDSVVILIGGLINTVTNFYLISHYGMYGAAISTILSYIVMNILYTKLSQRYFKLKFQIYNMIKNYIFVLSVYLIYYIISIFNLNIILETAIGNLLFLSYSFILYKYLLNKDIKNEIKLYLLNKIWRKNTNGNM